MKKPKLIPPDRKRCQYQLKTGCWPDGKHFMAIGPPKLVRCSNKPAVIVKENHPGDDGRCGSMSLCNDHWKELIKEYGPNFATATPV